MDSLIVGGMSLDVITQPIVEVFKYTWMGRSIHNLYPLFRNIYIDMTLNKYNNTMRIRITAIIIL